LTLDFVSGTELPNQPGKGLDFIISRIFPNPYQDHRAIITEYKEEIDRVYPEARYDVDSLEGYINTSIFIDVLQNLSPPFTLEKIIQRMEFMKN
jgi:hypothetical protein